MRRSFSTRFILHRVILLGGLEAGNLPRRRAVVQIPEALVLNIEDVVEARQRGDDVAVLLVEMLERGILMEDIHALPLREDDADGAVLEYQPCLPSEENTHLLVQPQLNKVVRQALI
ncbi:MAG: hypothetical protein IAE89_13635 [Anaerolineae bacterium]|nr:hypothetical protein [Anaerolineae bacterium]